MNAAATWLRSQFDDPEHQLRSATYGMWVFLASEVMFFGGLSFAYVVYRFAYPEAYVAASGHEELWLGTINTAVLLTSSLTMATAVAAARFGRRRLLVTMLLITVAFGVVFLVIKGFEYYAKWADHLVPGASYTQEPGLHHGQLFFAFYFAMTGLHAVHLFVGIVILLLLVRATIRGAYSPEYFSPVQIAGLYWHFVDVVWVFLFPLFYLVR